MPAVKPLQHVPQEPPRPTFTVSSGGAVSTGKSVKKKKKKNRLTKSPKPTGKEHREGARTTIRTGKSGLKVQDHRVAAAIQATALPDPIPAEGSAMPKLKPNTGTTLSIPPSVTPVVVPNPMISGLLVSSIVSTTTIWATPTSSLVASTGASLESSSADSARRLPIYVIVLLAFGSTSLAITALSLIICLCRGKRRPSFPTPSAPILQDSPLFGGKERLSRGLWADPSFGNLRFSANKSASLLRVGKGDGWKPLGVHNGISDSESEKTLRAPDSAIINEKLASPSPAVSVLPSSIPSSAVGLALETPSYAPVIKQPLRPVRKDVPSSVTKAKRMSAITSMYGGAEISSPTFTETMIAYQTPRPAPSPGKPKPALKPSTAPRDLRAQGSLKKSNSGRSASNPRRHSVTRSDKEKEDPFLYAIPSVKSQERRDRDTKALTSALGLASPPLNPTTSNNNTTSCFSPISIYPEDSLSMKRRTSLYRSEMPSPTSMSAALGSLMLQDFPSTATFASFKSNGNADPFANPVEPITLKKKVAHDKPPRVPSPPPLPSLAQMALANADPDYRSPTYSIYGYYESQRKSKASFATDLM
ncbi:hypothetical protein SCHPADRAFT_587468 [Schizopora paradoxa]|uniref:Uncharacterized protein n=1 Tax=Schizopora paradoxa TaxID=27342 RepID=A0A0H2RHI4_9AGAM|nr:hypothetical protein SCHPADRAFT_587468 [Schizopora paradoxa]